MSELNKSPRIQQKVSEIRQCEAAIRSDRVAGRMLHESVCDQDKKTGKPAAGRNANGGQEVIARPESLFSPDQSADKRALEKEGKHALHGQRLANDRARIPGECSPIRPKLELHRNAGYNADGEIETENLRPKPRSPIVLFISGSQRAPLPINEEPSQTHRQLREEVVVSNRKCEMDAMPKGRV